MKPMQWKSFIKKGLVLAIISLLLLGPYFMTTSLLPKILLKNTELAHWEEAKTQRAGHMKVKAFGQLLTLKQNLTAQGFKDFFQFTSQKIVAMKTFFSNSWALLFLFIGSLLFMTVLSRNHFTFYLFAVSIFYLTWWLFAVTDIWYRYLFFSEFIFIIGAVASIPHLFKEKKRVSIIAYSAIALLFLFQCSFTAIQSNLDDTERKELQRLANYTEQIKQEQIFCMGWFQMPRLALKTNNRFYNAENEEQLKNAIEQYDFVYLLGYQHDQSFEEKRETLPYNVEKIEDFGWNMLYKVTLLNEDAPRQ
jgi:hypothetical protein